MQNLKSKISRYMTIITAGIISVIIVVSFVVGLLNSQHEARNAAESMLIQIEQLLEENQKDLETVEQEYKQSCLNRAKAIAYILQENPEAVQDAEELDELAALVEVDEIHIFNEEGRIYAGTHPAYYDLTFRSGEQINYFLPMLTDKSLEMVQEIMPNTAENKLMQYSALWNEGGDFIVQVGREPIEVAKATAKNELSYIFTLLRVNEGVDYIAIDAKTENVAGATEEALVGKKASQIGLKMSEIIKDKDGFHASINGKSSFIVFKQVGDNWIGRSVTNSVMYDGVPGIVLGLAICCILMGIVQVLCMTRYLNEHVVEGIYEVNKKLELIANGKLTESVNVKKSTEFVELSQYINDMVRSLMAGNRRLSYVLSKTHMLIGAYEYNDLTQRVVVTDQIAPILELTEEEMEVLVADKNEFKKYINHVQRCICDGEKNIYNYNRYREKYIRIEELYEHGKMFGVMIDMTEEIQRRKQIEAERDIDLLTGLYNRRGLENRLKVLFSAPEQIGHGAIIMIDADGLKEINDQYGHDNGDVYLKKIANIIKGFGISETLASRQGGDEYVLVLYDYASEAELMNTIGTLEHIQNNSTVHLNEGQDVPLKFSFGYTIIGERTDYLAMMHEADEKMYQSKRIRKGKKE